MRSRFVRPAVAASACALLISASVGVSTAAFADGLLPVPVPTISVSTPPVGPIGGVTVEVPGETAAPEPTPTPTGASEAPAATGGSGNETSGAGASSTGAESAPTATTTTTEASGASAAAAASAAKSAAAAKSSGAKSAAGTSTTATTPPVLGPSHEGTTIFSGDSSPLGILAGSSPARTVMSNSVGIAMLGGLGAILLVVIGLRLAVLRRRSQA